MTTSTQRGLAISGVTLGHGRKPVIADLTLPLLRPGTVTALIGPNGAGKSTLLRGLAGLGELTGSVRLDGQELVGRPRSERAARLGYMPQSLPPGISLSVLESVVSALRASPSKTLEAPHGNHVSRAHQALAEIGIADLGNRELAELSGGQRQMAGLAQAIARRPEVLLLDEPTSALDLRYQTLVMNQVARLARGHGMVVIVVMHDIALAARYADQVAVLWRGGLHAFGTPAAAITSAMLGVVYEVVARVETCSRGSLQIAIDQAM
jgi:iron complex transport system ATP-binding protein